MKILSLAEARRRFSELVAEVEAHHEQYLVTKNGRPVAMVVSADEWEEITETAFWRNQEGIHEAIAEARAELARGEFLTADELPPPA